MYTSQNGGGNLFLQFPLKSFPFNISLNYICIDSKHNSHLQDCKRFTLCVASCSNFTQWKNLPISSSIHRKDEMFKKSRRTWFSGHEKDSNKNMIMNEMILFGGKMIRINPKDAKRLEYSKAEAGKPSFREVPRENSKAWWMAAQNYWHKLPKVCSTQKMTEKAGKNVPKEYMSVLKTKKFHQE